MCDGHELWDQHDVFVREEEEEERALQGEDPCDCYGPPSVQEDSVAADAETRSVR